MIIPSIDLMGGEAVQLIGGEQLAIAAGDPRPLLDRFSLAGEVAVIDLDAARGEGSNAELIRELCQRARVRVGGGIRSVETARQWLDAGASKVILGTAASPELLRALPRERTVVALDSRDGDVVTHVDGEEIEDFADFQTRWKKKVATKPREIVLTVVRGDTNEVFLVRIECLW